MAAALAGSIPSPMPLNALHGFSAALKQRQGVTERFQQRPAIPSRAQVRSQMKQLFWLDHVVDDVNHAIAANDVRLDDSGVIHHHLISIL